MLSRMFAAIGKALAGKVTSPTGGYVSFSATPAETLAQVLRPGDILLVEGDSRVAAAIKFLTRSTWSHAAYFVGDHWDGPDLIEADLTEGVRAVPLALYGHHNTRICRPVGLSDDELRKISAHMIDSLGRLYDLRNIVDLVRYLIPAPPVPLRWRRRMLAFCSGEPTRAICSTLLAEGFQLVRYPILPQITPAFTGIAGQELLHIRHHSLFVPRDFDLSPYFEIVKPTLQRGFDPHTLNWARDAPDAPDAPQIAD